MVFMQRGQVFSLDFLISLIAVMAAIGLMIHAVELNTYALKEERQQAELKAVAETAGNMLVSNPAIVCYLVDGSGNVLGSLNNCLSMVDTSTVPPARWEAGGPIEKGLWRARAGRVKILTKEDLGIPNDYGCSISTTDGGLGGNRRLVVFNCEETAPVDKKNIYSAKRAVVVYNQADDSTVTKSELEDCMAGGACNLNSGTVTIEVWK